MKLRTDQVKHVAKLANLPLTLKEGKKYSQQLSEILDYAKKLDKVNVEHIRPTFNVTDNKNVLAEDICQSSLTQKEALSSAPQKKNSMFVTKVMFEK